MAKTEVDIYRDTNLRYLGYTNEVGEAFRSIVPKSIVWMSYVVASGYVLADTLDKAVKEFGKDDGLDKNKRVIKSASDTLLWQSFASVIIPGLTINKICATVQYLQKNYTRNPIIKNPWVSTIVGLTCIPIIIHPIDTGVEHVMNSTYRKWVNYHPQKEMKDG